MLTNKNLINLFTTTAISSILIFSNVACVKQKAASEEPPAAFKISEKPARINADIKAAEDLVEKAPDAPAAYNQLAVAYIRAARESGDFSLNSKAKTAVNRALELEPENLPAQKLQASLLLTFHRFEEALEAGEKLKQKFPKDALVYGVLTDANAELGNYEEAVNDAQKMVDLKPNTESFARVSHIRSLYGDTEGAILAMTQAASMIHPQDKEPKAWCLTRLGVEYFKAGRFEQAEQAFDAALKILPEFHLALAGKGQARMAGGDYENAIKFLQQAQDRVPYTQTVIDLGNLYKKTGNLEKATEQYNLAEVIEQRLGINNDQRALALLWADQDMRLDEALAIAEREHAARKDVYTADIYAWCLYKKGRFDEAKKIINEAMRLKNKDARIFYHAGMIEKALGNKKEARQFLQQALETNPAFDLLQADAAKAGLQELS